MLILDALAAFRQGKEIANAETWKNRTVAINAIAAFVASVLAVARGMGYSVDVDQQTIETLAAGVVAAVSVFNGIMHVITSARVGLPSDSGAGRVDVGSS